MVRVVLLWSNKLSTSNQNRIISAFLSVISLGIFIFAVSPVWADSSQPSAVKAKAAILGDVDSGAILFEQEVDQRRAPASLTKIMTLYLVYEALANGSLALEDKLPVSEVAWRMGGSKTFVRVGDLVRVKDLILGIAVQSGNDACVVMAEHLAGSQAGFSDMMNNKAKELGMTVTHFVNPTGLPDDDHYSTARDIFILARALIRDFPQYANFVQEKQYTFNGIRQYNRNRLLWKDPTITGLKTGHTKAAGYCLIASNKKDGQRLVAVIMGARSSKIREGEALRLLRYGNRVYTTVRLYEAGAKVHTLRIWKGESEKISLIVPDEVLITIRRKQRGQLEVGLKHKEPLIAPYNTGEKVGSLLVKLGDEVVQTVPVVAAQGVKEGSFVRVLVDAVRLRFGL